MKTLTKKQQPWIMVAEDKTEEHNRGASETIQTKWKKYCREQHNYEFKPDKTILAQTNSTNKEHGNAPILEVEEAVCTLKIGKSTGVGNKLLKQENF